MIFFDQLIDPLDKQFNEIKRLTSRGLSAGHLIFLHHDITVYSIPGKYIHFVVAFFVVDVETDVTAFRQELPPSFIISWI